MHHEQLLRSTTCDSAPAPGTDSARRNILPAVKRKLKQGHDYRGEEQSPCTVHTILDHETKGLEWKGYKNLNYKNLICIYTAGEADQLHN